jgi:hypothetical protein
MFATAPITPDNIGFGQAQNNPAAVQQIANMPGLQEHLQGLGQRLGAQMRQTQQMPQPGIQNDPSQPTALPGLDPMMLVNALRGQ